jgi:hypothetical protein
VGVASVKGLTFDLLRLEGAGPERYADFVRINHEGVGMLSPSEIAAYGDEGLIIPSGFRLPDGSAPA